MHLIGQFFLCIKTLYAADNNKRVVNDDENGNDNCSNYIHLCLNFLIPSRVTDVGKIFSTTGQHHIFFEIGFQRINTKNRL